MTRREQIKELLYKWSTEEIIPMRIARKEPEGGWNNDKPGCHRIIKDPRNTLNLWVTLYVGQSDWLNNRAYGHSGLYREFWVQRIIIPNSLGWQSTR